MMSGKHKVRGHSLHFFSHKVKLVTSHKQEHFCESLQSWEQTGRVTWTKRLNKTEIRKVKRKWSYFDFDCLTLPFLSSYQSVRKDCPDPTVKEDQRWTLNIPRTPGHFPECPYQPCPIRNIEGSEWDGQPPCCQLVEIPTNSTPDTGNSFIAQIWYAKP